jgi:hypothetical protein
MGMIWQQLHVKKSGLATEPTVVGIVPPWLYLAKISSTVKAEAGLIYGRSTQFRDRRGSQCHEFITKLSAWGSINWQPSIFIRWRDDPKSIEIGPEGRLD